MKKKILVIDDDPDIRELLAYNLEKAGYQVVSTSSGLTALWEIEEDPLPDLVLLDLMMPAPDGYEICHFLKSSDYFRNIPLVIISAKGTHEDIEKGLSLGANAYLPKPFSLNQLFQVIQQAS